MAVTGQQVGLFGGPLFSLFKALTAVKLAAEATAGGVECVPVFWLATEDHDLEEVNHIAVAGPEGALQTLSTPTTGRPDAPVGTVQFGEEINGVVDAAGTLLGSPEAMQLLRACYRPRQTLGSSFANLFAQVFAEWGVILLDASDPELHGVAEPIYRAAIERAVELDDSLLRRGQELESAGYHQQVKVTPSSTLLFTLRDGSRVPIHRKLNGNGSVDFLVGEERIPQGELLREITAAPEQFSANVLLRPVVQDYLLPTLAYTGGAAEVAYFAQAAVVYQALLGHVTPVVPRFSATLVEAKPQRLLERYAFTLPELFAISGQLREVLAKRALPADLQAAFDRAGNDVEASFAAIRGALARLDATLVEAAGNASEKVHHQLEQLRARAARAELRQTEVLGRHAEVLGNLLYPNRGLQEREIAGIYFLDRQGMGFLRQILDAIQTDCLDHQVIYLQS
jgi:bacillithiol biosynthesis cysteine-adding enzyme BshC